MGTLINKILIINYLLLLSCTGEMLLRTEACKFGSKNNGVDCAGSAKFVDDCVDPELDDIEEGESFTLCDGTTAQGTMKLCQQSGEESCVTNAKFTAAEMSKVTSSNIAKGKTILGVEGARLNTKICRNTGNLKYFDMSSVSDDKFLPVGILSIVGGNIIQTSWDHGLTNNDPVQIFCSINNQTGLDGGEVFTNTTYYVNVVATNQFQLKSSPASAILTISSNAGCTGGAWTVSSPSDGILSDIDLIDDMNNPWNSTKSPTDNIWGNDYICNETNFTNISTEATYVPNKAIPTYGNKEWVNTWRDELSGIAFTNILYDGNSGIYSWHHLRSLCPSLDSSIKENGWRLPTQKEMMQLYINGIAKILSNSGAFNHFVWTSTTDSLNVTNVYTAALYGTTQGYSRNFTQVSVICIK